MRKTLTLLLFTLLVPLSYLNAADEVHILWQAHTYTPPFYKGLPLWSNQSRVTLLAMPNLPGVNPSSIIYRWTRDGVVLGPSSGVNKRSIIIGDTVLSLPTEVQVDIFLEEGTEPLGSDHVVLEPITTKLMVYENNPLYGLLLNKSITSEFEITEDEATFAAIPFYANVSTRTAPSMTYTWITNTGDTRSGPDITYRAPEEGSGSASITLESKHSQTIMEPRKMNFLIKFDNTDDNLFGF
ncbi:MAG: hypothetical protein ACYCY6_01800 [Minisyncoccota bacterium]